MRFRFIFCFNYTDLRTLSHFISRRKTLRARQFDSRNKSAAVCLMIKIKRVKENLFQSSCEFLINLYNLSNRTIFLFVC